MSAKNGTSRDLPGPPGTARDGRMRWFSPIGAFHAEDGAAEGFALLGPRFAQGLN